MGWEMEGVETVGKDWQTNWSARTSPSPRRFDKISESTSFY